MHAVPMVSKTIRIPVYLVDQIEAMATVSCRSFTKQCQIMLENAVDGTVATDLEMLRKHGARLPADGETVNAAVKS